MPKSWTMLRSISSQILALSLMTLSSIAFASGNSGITYQGRILKPDGSPLAGANVQFRMQLRTPNANNCLMYEEIQSQDMRNSNGAFSLTINDGTGSRLDGTGLGLDRIFANRGAFTFAAPTCSTGTTYTPSDGDGRNLVVLFKDETMATWEPIPAAKINYVPYAFASQSVQGFGADSLLRVVDGAGDPLTGLAPLSNAQYTELMALVNGTSTAFTKNGQLGGVALPTMNTGEALGWNGTAWVSTPAGTPAANSITTTMLQSASVTGAKLDPAISIATSGTVASAITTTRDFKIFATSPSTFYVGMLAPALASSYTLTWPMNAGASGQVLTTNGTGTLTWSTPSASGITALTGDVTATGPGSVAATVAQVGGVTAANVALGANAANAATPLNTVSTIVSRDASGNFAAKVATVNGVALNNGGSLLNIVNPIGGVWTMTLPQTAGANGQVMQTNGSGVMTWSTPLTSASAFVNGGNSFGATSSLGNSDVFDLNIKTSNLNRMTIAAGGNVGIGTTAPTQSLSVMGGVGITKSQTAAYASTGSAALPNATQGLNLSNFSGGDGNALLTTFTVKNTAGYTQNAYLGFISESGAIATPTFVLGQQSGLNSYQERMRIDANGNVGIGTTAPATKLEVAGSVRVGDGGEICAAALTGAIRYNGGNLQFCNGTPPWTTLGVAGSGISALTGDVTATGPGSATATVASVGGVTAANVALGANAASAATNANTFSTIVKRDGAGNFSAGAVNVGSTVYRDGTSNTATLQAPSTVTTSYVLKLPPAAATANQLLQSDSSGNMSWVTMPTALPPNGGAGGDLSGTYPNPTVATVGAVTAANVALGANAANAATPLNTSSTIVSRDGSGNFLAGRGTFNSGIKVTDGVAGGQIGITAPVGFTSYVLTLPPTAGSSGQVLSTNGSGVTSWITAGGATPWTTQAPGINYMAGNVGIGTTSPVSKLEVVGDVTASRFVTSSAYAGTVLVGSGSSVAGTGSTIVGSGASSSAGYGQTVLGYNASTNGDRATALGHQSSVNGQDGIAIGMNTSSYWQSIAIGAYATNGYQFSIALGESATTTAMNQMVVGGSGSSISNAYIGNGVTNATPVSTSINATGGTGTDIAGANLTLRGGASTGSGTGGFLSFETASPGTTGATVRTPSERMRITSAGNVGVGTTSPANLLQIGTTALANTDGVMVAGGGSLFFRDSTTKLYELGGLNIDTGGSGNRPLLMRIQGAEKMRVDTTGNVGIGTTSPSYKLDVAGDVNVTGNFKINGTNLATGGAPGGANQQIQFNNSGAFGASSNLTWDGTDLGIGNVPLNSGNSIRASSLGIVEAKGDGGYAYASSSASQTLPDMYGANMKVSNTAFATTEGAYYVMQTNVASSPIASYIGEINGAGSTGNIVFGAQSGASSYSERMRIQGSNGNVGIGTTLPGQKLSVSGTIESTTGGFKFPDGTTQTTAAAGGASQWTTSGSNIYYTTGNVGIGTSSSSAYPLDVKAAAGDYRPAIFRGDASQDTAVITVTSVTGTGKAGMILNQPGNGAWAINLNSANVLVFDPAANVNTPSANATFITNGGLMGLATSAPKNRLDVSGALAVGSGYAGTATAPADGAIFKGDVGIGTTAPSATLEIQTPNATAMRIKSTTSSLGANMYLTDSTSNALQLSMLGSTAAALWGGGLAGEQGTIGTTGTQPLTFATNYSQRMIIDSSGKVGIGTTAPAQKLSVSGTIESTSGGFKFPDGTTQTTAGAASQWTTNAGNIYFNTGNVGIGVSSPVAKIDVVGQAVARDFNVASGASVSFANGNVQTLANPGSATIALSNMVGGGNYTLVLTDVTTRTYAFTGCSNQYWATVSAPTTARTIFSIQAITNGGGVDCYIAWTTGFQ
jgi:hypothetical protein